MTHLEALRAIVARASLTHPLAPVDADLREEAGMDGNLGRLLQVARDFDCAASNHPPGSMLTGSGAPGRWFDFTLGFADDGPDLDTVRASLGLWAGWVVHVEPVEGQPVDVVFLRLEQDDAAADFPVFLVGHRYDDNHAADNDFRGEPVRIPLAGARITVY
jgi:hypothetical protein